eukprot:scaffold1702_cov253-Pinguiococcus_pyrenoidosus.AAC.8
MQTPFRTPDTETKQPSVVPEPPWPRDLLASPVSKWLSPSRRATAPPCSVPPSFEECTRPLPPYAAERSRHTGGASARSRVVAPSAEVLARPPRRTAAPLWRSDASAPLVPPPA